MRNSLDMGEKAPIWMHVRSSQLELRNYWSSLPQHAQQDSRCNPVLQDFNTDLMKSIGILLTNYYCAQLGLLEPCVDKGLWPSGGPNVGNPHRLDMLYYALTVVKVLLDQVFGQPIEAYLAFSGADIVSLGYGLTTLIKLSFINEPGWDLNYVRQTVSFASYFDKCYMNFEQAGSIIDGSQVQPCRPCFQTLAAQKMKKTKAWFDAKVAAESQPQHTDGQPEQGALESDIDMNMEFDDKFWEDLLRDSQFI